jgi:Iap family predicted aminopeptidase
LRTILDGNLVEYQRFTACSDSNIYQEAGMQTVSISSDNMAYLDRIWERDTDRIELLDEANLQLAADLIVTLSNRVAERHTAYPSPVAQE